MGICVYWIWFALCSVCVCVCVFSEAQFSCLVWCADGWVGACEWNTLFLVFIFPLSFFLSFLPLLCSAFLVSPLISSPLSLFLLSFIYQLHPWLPLLFHHCICWGPSWAEESFPPLYFLSPSFFMRLSGLSAAAIRGGFGMKCLLTEPCAPELR